MTSNFQSSLPSDPLFSVAPTSNSNTDVSGGPTVQKKGNASIADTTASAGGTGSTGNNVDASNPQLVLNSNTMTSAQMYSMGMMIMEKARKQRIQSDAADSALQYQLSWGLKVGVGTITDPTGQTPPPLTKSSPSDKADNKESTSPSTEETQKPATQQSSSKSSNASNIPPANITQQTIESEISAMVTLETTLSDALSNVVKKQYKLVNPLATPKQLTDVENNSKKLINAYVRQILSAGNVQTLGSSLLSLKIPGVNALNLDSNKVDAATAVSFSEYIMGLVNSGNITQFASAYLFPNNPAAAKIFAANASSILLDMSLEQVGTALNMPGLATQVASQAKMVRDVNEVLTNPVKVQGIVQGVALNNAQASGLTQSQIQSKATQAIANAISQGPYLTQEDLLNSMTTSFATEFPNKKQLSDLLAEQILTSSFDEVMGKNKYTIPPVSVDSNTINVNTVTSSLQNSIQNDFIKSDREVRQAKKDADAAHAIIADVNQKQYLNELAVRQDIQSRLMDKIPDMTPELSADISAKVDLGIKHTGPLYTRGDNQILPSASYSQEVQIGYQTTVHASPQLDFGKAIDHVTGISTGFDGTHMISLINQNYYNSGTENRSYLNLPASEQIKLQQQRIYDPGAQLVLSWGSVINGMSGADSTHPQPLSIQV